MREEALANCKLAEGGKVAGEDGHIEKMRKLRQRANEAGAKISDQRFITRLLDSFPESWDPVITPMMKLGRLGLSQHPLDVYSICTMLQYYDNIRASRIELRK
ncbi:hypothetical protein CPC08DRAFT_770628 [Agrocybe pediades]|nr:hypothetical protein CPC08DRAFT_770628 [Agrocybe pediades]